MVGPVKAMMGRRRLMVAHSWHKCGWNDPPLSAYSLHHVHAPRPRLTLPLPPWRSARRRPNTKLSGLGQNFALAAELCVLITFIRHSTANGEYYVMWEVRQYPPYRRAPSLGISQQFRGSARCYVDDSHDGNEIRRSFPHPQIV